MKRFILIALLILSCDVSAQWRTKYWSGGNTNSRQSLTVNGFIKSSNFFRYTKWTEDRVVDNILHLNLGINWKVDNNSSWYMSLHNRYFFGDAIESGSSDYANWLEEGQNWVDMNWVLVEEDKALLHTSIDRLFYQFTGTGFYIRAGKQRINWNQTLIWNPNDYFNTFSFLNFDYATGSGIDAVYGSFNFDRKGESSIQVGYAPQDLVSESIFAARYLFSNRNVDWQLTLGRIHEDYSVGTGWTTFINRTGFSGEVSYFKDVNNESENDVFSATLATFYQFPSKLILHAEANYNSNPANTPEDIYNIFFQPLSAKYVTFNEYSVALLAQYPINKYWSFGASGISYVDIDRYYLSAYTKVELPNDLSFLLSTQLMDEEGVGVLGTGNKYLFGRIMWAF